MNNVIKETKKVMELQPKIDAVFNEIDNFASGYKTLEKENQNIQREIKSLKTRNQNLTEENNKLNGLIHTILNIIKDFFRHSLKIGNVPTKEATTNEIKDYYDNETFDSNDIYGIAKQTPKEDKLFDDVELPSYLKTPKDSSKDKGKDDFEISLQILFTIYSYFM